MSNVTLELEAAKLRDLTDVVTISDVSGRILGRFIPALESSIYEGIEVPLDTREIQVRRQDRVGFTTAEVRAHLKGLESS